MTKQKDNETNKKQVVAEFIRKTYFTGCSFHRDHFMSDCNRCLTETERVLDEERTG